MPPRGLVMAVEGLGGIPRNGAKAFFQHWWEGKTSFAVWPMSSGLEL